METVNNVSLDTDGEVSFLTDSFSTFIGYTVDFHYNGITYSISGQSNILLSALFEQLQIQKDATTATSVKFTDETLVSVEQQKNGDWLLTSLKAFQTNEYLTITFSDCEVITVHVTDVTTEYIWGEVDGVETLTAKNGDLTLFSNGKVGINVNDGDTVTIRVKGACKFSDKFAGIKVYKDGRVNIYHERTSDSATIFRGACKSSSFVTVYEEGSAIKNRGLIMDNVKMYGCTAKVKGGGLLFAGRIDTDCKINKLYIDGQHKLNAINGAAVCMTNNAKLLKAVFTNCTFKNCNTAKPRFWNTAHTKYSQTESETYCVRDLGDVGGTFRTEGESVATVQLTDCTFDNNDSFYHGGGLYWNAAGSYKIDSKTYGSSVAIDGCTFINNSAGRHGGAIYCEALMTIEDTEIVGNQAGINGAGAYIGNYSNEQNLGTDNGNTSITLGAGVKIHKNIAKENGGGIGIAVKYSDVLYYNYMNKIIKSWSVSFGILSDDVEIYDNIAGLNGGGVWFNTSNYSNSYTKVTPTGKFKESALDKVTDEQKQYFVNICKKSIKLQGGKIHNNKTGKSGGGIYAYGKNTTVTMSPGKIYSNEAGAEIDT